MNEKSAAIVGNKHNVGLAADHRGMNKFESSKDPNYVKVLERLKGILDSSLENRKAVALTVKETNENHPGHEFSAYKRIIPYSKNTNFTGREDICAKLDDVLAVENHGHFRAALCGLGGSG